MPEPNFPAWTEQFVVFDLETTGVDVQNDRIVTAHVGMLNRDGQLVGSEDWLVDPGVPIPAAAAAVHGVSTERARAEGLAAPDAVRQIVDRLRSLTQLGHAVVAYNAAYDFSLLFSESRRHGIEPLRPSRVIDPLIIDKALDRYRKGKRTLGATAEHYGVALDSAHQASADAVAAGRIALALCARFSEIAALEVDDLHRMQVSWSDEQAQSYAGWRHAQGDTNFAPEQGWPVRDSVI